MQAYPGPRSYESHLGPGRRFAMGSTRGDHLVGAFGFLSHAILFFGLGALTCHLWYWLSETLAIISLSSAVVLLAARAAQVGLTTTRESIAALREAWRP